MQIDDLVLVPNKEEINFCQIKSDYLFDPKFPDDDKGYLHQRKVKWLTPIKRDSLPMDIRSSLKAQHCHKPNKIL